MKKIIVILILLAIAAGISLKIAGIGPVFLEKTPPDIALSMEAVPNDLPSIKLTASDKGSGLAKISVKAEQDGQTTELYNNVFQNFTDQDQQLLPLSKYKTLKEGALKITASASDASMWGNSSEKEISFTVDYSPPKLQLHSLQHVAAQGGAEFVIYTVSDSNLKSHGVQVGGYFFPGYDAGSVNQSVSDQKDLKVSLFALPMGYEFSTNDPQIRAEDTSGNITTIPLHFRLEKKPQNSVVMNLKEDYLQRKDAELMPGYRRYAGQKNIPIPDKPADITDMLWQFRLINENYRAMLDKELLEVSRASDQPRLWKETFIKPMPSATSSTFGEKRSYTYENTAFTTSVHNGVDLASVNADAVHAANDGLVAIAGDMGIYGNAVFIDHGLGLFTLYGHLSSIGVKKGDKVTRGQEIGRTGQTGLAGGDHLHFEFRIREVPVTPIEWWDSKWIKDNIDGKFEELKE